MQWCCPQFLQFVAKSRAEFYIVQHFAQQQKLQATHVTLCNSPATCVATALRDKLLRKLCSVTYLTSVNKYCFLRFCFPLVQSHNTTVGLASDVFHKNRQKLGNTKVRNGRPRNHIEIEKFHVCPNYEPWATLKHLVLFKPFTDESKCDFI